METIRTFIAVPLPGEIITHFREFISEFKPQWRDVKWVKPESIHLTLKFLGNLKPDEVRKVFSAMDQWAGHLPSPFQLTVGGTGAFPSFKRPRVFWVGVSGSGLPALKELQAQLDTTLEKEGFPREERSFSPHLTIARIRDARFIKDLIPQIQSYPFPESNFTVKRIDVMRSQLHPGGARYSIQKSYFLERQD